MISGGLVTRIRKFWWGSKKICSYSDHPDELGFSQTISSFIVLIVGWILSICLLLFEIGWKKMLKVQQNKTKISNKGNSLDSKSSENSLKEKYLMKV